MQEWCILLKMQKPTRSKGAFTRETTSNQIIKIKVGTVSDSDAGQTSYAFYLEIMQ